MQTCQVLYPHETTDKLGIFVDLYFEIEDTKAKDFASLGLIPYFKA
jgi:hypothetical protein